MVFIVACILISATIPMAALADNGQNGTTLSAEVCAQPHYTKTFHWTIDKSVTPDAWNLFRGDSGTSRYTIAVTKDAGTDSAYITGEVCVTNGGSVATQGLNINIVLKDGVPPPNDVIGTYGLDVSGHPVLAPGETYCYPFIIDVSQVHAGGPYKVTADVTITDHSGYLGEPFGPSPSCAMTMPATPTLVNDGINVDDSNGGSWQFADSGSVSYDKTFTACADQGRHENTATIRETRQSDTATVTVNCYGLEVTKCADTAFKRTYHWTIDKQGDQTDLTLKVGETFDVNYEVTVDATYVDSDYAARGTITVRNPAPIPATINSVTDLISPDIAAGVESDVTFPYTLAAGETLKLTYAASLPDGTSRVNTATATLQNYAYNSEKVGTPSGTTDFSGTASVDFSEAHINVVDESIAVSDTYAGSLGTVSASEAPRTFEYTRTVGPYEPGDYSVVNTASFVTCDTGTTGSDRWTVVIHVHCEGRICGYKYYDANLNGVYDAGDSTIKGWQINLINGTGAVIATAYTNSEGYYCFDELPYGTYTVAEVFPTLASGKYVSTNGITSYTRTLRAAQPVSEGNNFFNVRLTNGCGGRTIGFWTNKNGQALIASDDIAAINGLDNLYTYLVWPEFTSNKDVKAYLNNANSVHMEYMLSAQLIATELNVHNGFIPGGAKLYIDGYGFVTADQAIKQAQTELVSGTRQTQEYWKNVLDKINNNAFYYVQ